MRLLSYIRVTGPYTIKGKIGREADPFEIGMIKDSRKNFSHITSTTEGKTTLSPIYLFFIEGQLYQLGTGDFQYISTEEAERELSEMAKKKKCNTDTL